MLLLAVIAIGLCGLTVGLLVHALSAPRARTATRLREIGSYGFAADSLGAAASGPVHGPERPLSALAGRVGEFAGRFLGRVSEDAMRAELVSAGLYRLTPGMLLGYRVIASVGAFAYILATGVSAVLPPFPLAIVCGGAAWMLPLTFVRRRASQRLALIERALPDLIDLMVVTVEAGQSFGGSMQIAAARLHGPLRDELRLTLQEQQLGLPTREALEHLLARARTASMQSFVRAIIQGEELGVSIGTTMRSIAHDMRIRRRQSAEERAQKAPTKLLFPLVFLIFPALFIVLLGPAAFGIIDTVSGR